ncbi:uncharacterized protein LOC106135032 [Amyelois transitella]|uniref:uncharacterized protein LOC106135032 n=1 Tax=Amyelois transitella TaxID=680683 RepID=UPI00067B32AB|nr:uncharacterized protein LOC106135032 [Amyelois transitella]
MFKLYIAIIFSLVRSVVSDCPIAQECVTDLTPEDCEADLMTYVPNSVVEGCCPGCQFNPGVIPPPAVDGCQAPSNCLPDGQYAPVQCKGDYFTGRCFCSDANGTRIFGQMWRNEAQDMTCACSRRRAELEAAGNRGVTLHCTRSGNYEPLQCDYGMCWCAQPRTGQPTTIPVPESEIQHLTCYNPAILGEQYLRRCESIIHALATINKEHSDHGTNFLGLPTTYCDYDGSYGPYQIRNGIAYCTGRDGEILGSWQAMSTEMSGMRCNCARDSAVYFPEAGRTLTEVCQANGNYQPHQNVGDVYYCVDADGYITPEGFMDAWPADRCASYA